MVTFDLETRQFSPSAYALGKAGLHTGPTLIDHVSNAGHAIKHGLAVAGSKVSGSLGMGIHTLGPVKGLGIGSALGAGAGYVAARLRNRFGKNAKRLDRKSLEWKKMRNKYMKRGAAIGGAAGLGLGLMSDPNQYEDRAYAVDWKKVGDTASKVGSGILKGSGSIAKRGGHILRSSTGGQWAAAGAGINMYRNNKKRKELQAKYEAQGKTPEEARYLAKKQTSGLVSSAIKGAAVGGMARKVASGVGLKKNATDFRIARRNLGDQTKTTVQTIREQAKLKQELKDARNQIKQAKKGL